MYILWSNLLQNAGITAESADPNYPVDNLKSTFLRKKFQSVNLTDTKSVSFESLTTINSVYYAYTNAIVTIKIYDGLTLLDTLSGADVYHFANIDTDRVDFELSVGEPAYLGGLGVGLDHQIDPPESFWTEAFEDRSVVSESDAGQVLQEYTEPLRLYQFSIPTMDQTEARELQTKYVQTGIGRPVWVDPDTDDLPMLYCTLTAPVSVQKRKRQYTASISFKEAR